MSESKNELDLAFEEFEHEAGENKTIRKEMIKALQKVVANPEMEITPYDKSMLIQSKLMIFKTLDDLLKSNEDVTMKRVKMKLTRKNDETNGVIGESIVNLLKNIRVTADADGNTIMDPTKTMDDLNKRVKEMTDTGSNKIKQQLAISEGELEVCDKLTTDAKRPEDEPTEE